MTLFFVRVLYCGKAYERAFESMTERNVFTFDAKKIGAQILEEWVDAAPDVAQGNEQIVATATEKWLRTA